jgi:transposase
LKAHGHTRAQVATVLAIDVSTVRVYFDLYLEEGIAALKRLNYHGKRNALQEREKDILAALEAKPPATVKEAQDTIKTATDLCRSWTRVKEFLRRNKVRRRKVKALPDKANVDAQEAFKTGTLEPLVEAAQQSRIHLFFVDASHFVLMPFLGYLYSRTVRFLKSSSGRKRFSVLGALHVVTQELVVFSDHAYINATSVCALFQKLHDQFQDLPLVLVLDNARYQKCALVLEKARQLNILLVYLPPYSPNLNLIERLWKFVKKEVLYSTYYDQYDKFCGAICDCLSETHTTHREALRTLLNPKFQTFERVCFQR